MRYLQEFNKRKPYSKASAVFLYDSQFLSAEKCIKKGEIAKLKV